jgi:hypothetical protein
MLAVHCDGDEVWSKFIEGQAHFGHGSRCSPWFRRFLSRHLLVQNREIDLRILDCNVVLPKNAAERRLYKYFGRLYRGLHNKSFRTSKIYLRLGVFDLSGGWFLRGATRLNSAQEIGPLATNRPES